MFYWPFNSTVQTRGRWQRRGGRRSVGFASARGGGRLHAACDLMVPENTEIRAITDGVVLWYRRFYEGTWQLTVRHEPTTLQPFIVRYGEVKKPEDGGIEWNSGQTFEGGEVIAKVGRLDSGASMLHFELYATTQSFPSLSIGRRWRNGSHSRAPESFSQEERADIQQEGRWHFDFQRRVDLADPTDFLIALQQGQAPSQPQPYSQSNQVIPLEGLLVTPSEEFIREQELIRAREAQARRSFIREEARRQWYEEQGRVIYADEILSRGATRIPGPLDETFSRPNTTCEQYLYVDRHGPS